MGLDVRMMQIHDLELVAAVVLGATFAVAGSNKMRDPRGFVLGVLEYDILPRRLAVAFARVVPFAELGLAALLLTGTWLIAAGLASAVLLVSFLVAASINIARGRSLDCHCFGAEAGERLGWTTLVRLGLLLVCAGVVVGVGSRVVSPNLRDDLLISVGILLGSYLVSAIPEVARTFSTSGVPAPSRHGWRTSFRSLPLVPISIAMKDRTHETSRCGSCP